MGKVAMGKADVILIGASTAIFVMLDVLERCFPDQMKLWQGKIKQMIPSYGIQLADDPILADKIQTETAKHSN
ncbi:malate:quinone oxidoreductase [Sporolactobacillus inulinus]|uniref:malate dehydrogenase (quinone) n=1 Tax=Sporolactobacillus inulinus TaxID=2078 RepID=A0A4Y1Z9B0_9BACL|nr:malate:quinone oxidoreductase [Sporolactobacillus inulinus]